MMANKKISQDTFDEVVRENIDEFEMSPQDAMDDAVQQFQSQDVDLSNIVRDLHLYDGSTTQQPSKQAVDDLCLGLQQDPLDLDYISTSLQKLKKECDIDLAHRCLAATYDAFPTLVLACENFRNSEKVLCQVLSTLASFLNGQPDFMKLNEIKFSLELLKEKSDDAAIVQLVLTIIRYSCIKHEGNRQSYVGQNLIVTLVDLLIANKSKAAVVKEACSTLRTLTLDDDIRVPFGKAHEHAKIIVMDGGALKILLEISQDYITDATLLGELFSTLGRLAVRDEFCQEIMDLGGLRLFLNTLQSNNKDISLVKQVIGVLKAVAGNDAAKVAIVKNGGIPLLLNAISQHIAHVTVCDMGCACLATLALRQEANSENMMENGVAEVIVKAMQIHSGALAVQKQACLAIRNLVARNRENSQPFLLLGVEVMINDARTKLGDFDEAKAALRDLDCRIELKELWKGEGFGLAH